MNTSEPTALREPDATPFDADELLLRSAERVVYKATPQGELSLFVVRPFGDAASPRPAVVYFTGGGWRGGQPHYNIANAAWFAARGWIGIAADYRVRERHGTTPLECVKDARSALRFVRANAALLGVDPAKIVAAGGSAGGHIASCCAYDCSIDESTDDRSISPRPAALALHNPVTGGPGFEREFFTANPHVAPVSHIGPDWPPTVLSCGTADPVTPYADAVAFYDRLIASGVAAELITIPDAPHSCDWPASNPHYEPTMRRMHAFLTENGVR